MAIQGNTFEAFTIAFAALSLVFTVAATAGDYWLAYGPKGKETSEFGLWEYCEARYDEEKFCQPYPSVEGKLLIANIGMVFASIFLFVGLIISIMTKCKQFSENGYKVIAGILAGVVILGAGAEVIALNIFTAQTNNILSEYTEVHYGWSYISGWVAFAIATVCVGSILASVYNRRPMLSPYSIEVPYNQFDVSNSTTKVY